MVVLTVVATENPFDPAYFLLSSQFVTKFQNLQDCFVETGKQQG